MIYAVVIAVLVLALFASYRALGGGTPVLDGTAQRDLVVRLLGLAYAREHDLTEAVGAGDPADVAATAAVLRRDLAGYEQTLAHVEAAEDALAHGRVRLGRALRSLEWSCRLLAADGDGDHPALREAAAVLRRGAVRDLDAAAAVLRVPDAEGAGPG